MTERVPRPGEFYRHFKKGVYQIIAVAKHSETGEDMVVYQALYREFKVYVRPLSLFVDKVDKEKYPEAVQKYRFERINPSELSGKGKEREGGRQTATSQSMAAAWRESQEDARKEQGMTSEGEVFLIDGESDGEEGRISPRFLEFLDARSYEAKAALLDSLKKELTDEMIDSMAMAVDLEIPPGSLEERRQQLSRCLRTMGRYEAPRLR
ncbi:MAG: DUF1653 domain-containing protein [Lachnospiraceae bacterium]|jgi:hypothetical protein|nr:DUF1653 domain-containing protein [Lachnospiraceae bacterium]